MPPTEQALAHDALPAALQISNLNFYYGATKSLKNINLSIKDKKVTAFIGPSGCGKSTLLRTLNRMYDLYPGQRAEGKNPAGRGCRSVHRRHGCDFLFCQMGLA